ncbi:MAG TPA: PEGA domain-containing protein [Myxococcaceae bacterium]|nr:PEGA domain-containing protein [Myxococcaceae bacterium]
MEVYDGEVRLGTTPLTWVFKAGTYQLRLVDANGDSRLFSVEVKTGQENEYTVRFSDLPRDPR